MEKKLYFNGRGIDADLIDSVEKHTIRSGYGFNFPAIKINFNDGRVVIEEYLDSDTYQRELDYERADEYFTDRLPKVDMTMLSIHEETMQFHEERITELMEAYGCDIDDPRLTEVRQKYSEAKLRLMEVF